MPNNEFKAWPTEWPMYKQECFGSWEKRCDMLVGPCSCGAWHHEGEFEYKDGYIYRKGEQARLGVEQYPTVEQRAKLVVKQPKLTPEAVEFIRQGDELRTRFSDFVPKAWWGLYSGLRNEGFSEEQAMDLLRHWITITGMNR